MGFLLVMVSFGWVGPLTAASPTLTRVFSLKSGWNSVYLDIQPTNTAIETVMQGVPIASVWRFQERLSAVEFIQNPEEPIWNIDRWLVHVPTNDVASFENNLFHITGGISYLVRVTQAATWRVTGTPVFSPSDWKPNAYNLRGFPVDPGIPLSFRDYFKHSPAHSSAETGKLEAIYRLNDAGQWGLVAPTDRVEPWTAYWVYTRGQSSYVAPFEVRIDGAGGLNFDRALNEAPLRLVNRTPAAVNATIEEIGKPGETALRYSLFNKDTGFTWPVFPSILAQSVAGNSTKTDRFRVQRAVVPTDGYESYLDIRDNEGVQILIPVKIRRFDGGLSSTPATAASARTGRAAPLSPKSEARLHAGLWGGVISITHVSEAHSGNLLEQAGGRYEGPIAFNPEADAINRIGLIETYSTVLEVARRKSIDGTPALNYNPANNALILAASKISDLYMLLGNEAFADAADPTIGFGTTTGDYGTLASSVFAFQNQLDSLLDEELVLLRGRDDSGGGVQAPPVYNRLLWNFTLGEGEVAYQQVYNIQERVLDGFIDEKDARVMYPQGHGDAWGHYLTALTGYYELLQHTNFTWVPRAETVTVAGQGVQVDFLDERKFANAAAARAKAGREIVNLTYRRGYTGDPAGQWQGYKDVEKERAWGVVEWAGRAMQGAYFDWATANTILQAVDTIPSHTRLTKIDRTTVAELGEIVTQAAGVQATLDQSDQGMNPLGVAPGAIPFDIDPTFLEVGSTAQIGRRAVQGLFQFDQILERAIGAMNNAMNVWDQANRSTELLRKSQDTQVDFSNNIADQERDFKNRLIELYGYPYAGDIGPGRTYPSNYDGPDLYHYMYVDNTAVDTQSAPISSDFTAFFTPLKIGFGPFSRTQWSYTFNDGVVADPSVLETSVLPVLYPMTDSDYGFRAPLEWGKRRAAGEIQMALSDCVQAQASLLDAVQTYCGLIADIQAQIDLLQNQRDIRTTDYVLKSAHLGAVGGINSAMVLLNIVEGQLRQTAEVGREILEASVEAIPKIVGVAASDISSAARGALRVSANGSVWALEQSANEASFVQNGLELSKEVLGLGLDLSVDILDREFEIAQRAKEIEHMMRDEYNLRIAAYKEAEVLRQNVGRYYSLLAEAQRVLDQRLVFRQRAAASTSRARYQDMTFRIFRNDAIQKYRATFDLAAKYVYLAANAYDYEVNFGASDPAGAARFKTDIVRQRSLGQMVDGNPAVGQPGLADSLARMEANWNVLKTQFGIIQPQISDLRFSLREELFRIPGNTADASANQNWKQVLTQSRVDDVWQVPEFRRYCRPFAPESAGPQPAIVIRFPTMIEFGRNFFGWDLSAGDSAYDSSQYSTKIARTGIWFSGTDGSTVAQVPRVYLVPVGVDILRTPTGDDFLTREFKVVDQVVPPPFPIGASDFRNPSWIPINDSLGGSFIQIRRHAAMPARHDAGIYAEQDLTNDTRLIGRSAWNTQWVLIIPGGTLLADPKVGLDRLVQSLSDIKIYFQAYSYSGL